MTTQKATATAAQPKTIRISLKSPYPEVHEAFDDVIREMQRVAAGGAK